MSETPRVPPSPEERPSYPTPPSEGKLGDRKVVPISPTKEDVELAQQVAKQPPTSSFFESLASRYKIVRMFKDFLSRFGFFGKKQEPPSTESKATPRSSTPEIEMPVDPSGSGVEVKWSTLPTEEATVIDEQEKARKQQLAMKQAMRQTIDPEKYRAEQDRLAQTFDQQFTKDPRPYLNFEGREMTERVEGKRQQLVKTLNQEATPLNALHQRAEQVGISDKTKQEFQGLSFAEKVHHLERSIKEAKQSNEEAQTSWKEIHGRDKPIHALEAEEEKLTSQNQKLASEIQTLSQKHQKLSHQLRELEETDITQLRETEARLKKQLEQIEQDKEALYTSFTENKIDRQSYEASYAHFNEEIAQYMPELEQTQQSLEAVLATYNEQKPQELQMERDLEKMQSEKKEIEKQLSEIKTKIRTSRESTTEYADLLEKGKQYDSLLRDLQSHQRKVARDKEEDLEGFIRARIYEKAIVDFHGQVEEEDFTRFLQKYDKSFIDRGVQALGLLPESLGNAVEMSVVFSH